MTTLSPKEFFGFDIGEDRKLARWDKIVEYFKTLEKISPRIKVVEPGKTTDGNPFIIVIITSPENMEKFNEYKEISRKLAYPYDIDENAAKELAEKGKAIVAISGSLHAVEVGGTQTLVQLAYELATRNDEVVNTILENVILIIFPCLNPDGQLMVIDWYNKYLDTEFEGSPPPWLYHRYAGHDNNRDAFMLNLVESKYFAKTVYREWIPQIYIDHHQMWMANARFFISPEMDPIYPEIDPLVLREIQFLGSYAASRLAREGLKGVETYSPFTPDFVSAFQTAVIYMNIAGILTEAASVKIASPIYIHPHQLRGYRRGRSSERPTANYPDPWPGGWWRLKDIVEYQKEATYAILEVVAKMKNDILLNMYVKARRSIEKGKSVPPYAYIITLKQHDTLEVIHLLEILMDLGVEVFVAEEPIEDRGKIYTPGSLVIPLSQPRRALIMKLFEKFLYPDNEFTRDREGNPIEPYDLATERLPDFFGLIVEEIVEPLKTKIKKLEVIPKPNPVIRESRYGWLLDPKYNDTHKLVVNLLNLGIDVYRISTQISIGDIQLPYGAFYIPSSSRNFELLREAAIKIGVEPISLENSLEDINILKVSIPKIGVYQRLYGGNTDEGWTRWLLETYGYSYKVVKDEPIKEGRLNQEIDILIIPNDTLPYLTGENIEEELAKRRRAPVKLPPWPPEYRSGFGQKGVENIKKFVEEGGKLIIFGEAFELLSKGFKLPLRDVTEEINDPKKFFCPGSTIRTFINIEHPLGWGMPREVPTLFINKPVIEITPHYENEKYIEVARFADNNLLISGWLIGEQILAKKPAVLEIKLGKGMIITYAIRPQFRGQTRTTFKLLFNALYSYRTKN
jgi:hypothetical protein